VLSAGSGSGGAEGGGAGDGDEPIDENDPLWKVFLKLAGGDRAKAETMLADPDEYMGLPEVVAALEGGGGGGDDDWESAADAPPLATGGGGGSAVTADTAPPPAPGGAASAAVAVVARSESGGGAAASAAGAEDAQEEEVVEEVVEQEADPREHLNLVFIGHVDAGKSTLSGNILYLTDFVDKKTIEKYEREAKQRNRESWFLAFIMDTSEEERAKGKTVEVGRAHFSTPERRFTVLDAPGHKSYVPNMISGASQADVGVLVVSARKNEFEAGFEKGGQTKEHAMLCKTLGVRTLVVVVNKMDDVSVAWSQARFDDIASKLKPFLKSCGFVVRTEVKIMPISALTGDNVKDQVDAAACPWWQGYVDKGNNNTSDGTLIGLFNKLTIEGRDAAGPLRIPVLDRYYDRGCVLLGKVENGTLSKGDKVMLMPTRTTTTITSLYSDDTPVLTVRPGDNCSIRLPLNVEDICKGFVLCHVDPIADQAKAVKQFIVFLYLADLTETRPLVTAGYDCIMHCHTCETEVVVKKILSVLDVKTKEKKKGVRFAKEGAQLEVVLEVPQSVCVLPFSECPQLGRLTLRDEGKTIAIGKVLKLVLPRPKGDGGGGGGN